MELVTMINAISGTMIIADLTYKFIKSLGMKSTPELEQKVANVLEAVKLDQTTEESLLEGLTNIPQLEHFDKEHLKKQFENIYNECTNSNVANYNNSDNNLTLQIHGNGTINISDLGSLRQVPNNDKKQVEDSLFESVKKLMIEFLEFITKNMNDKTFFQNYKICVVIKTMGGHQQYAVIPDSPRIALLYASMYMLKTKYKLTDNQLTMILNILTQIPPKIIGQTYIRFEESNRREIVFIIASLNYQEPFNRSCMQINNEEIIPQRLEEIKKGEWDSFIRTAIKELD